jgi:hypothetical protein
LRQITQSRLNYAWWSRVELAKREFLRSSFDFAYYLSAGYVFVLKILLPSFHIWFQPLKSCCVWLNCFCPLNSSYYLHVSSYFGPFLPVNGTVKTVCSVRDYRSKRIKFSYLCFHLVSFVFSGLVTPSGAIAFAAIITLLPRTFIAQWLWNNLLYLSEQTTFPLQLFVKIKSQLGALSSFSTIILSCPWLYISLFISST